MSKTSITTIPESQTGQQVDTHQQGDVVQSPPLISDQGLDHQDDQTARNDECVIDVSASQDKERMCRICQLGSEYLPEGAGNNNVKLVKLGCDCKGELGVSHYYCAKAWFLQKGNRTCEICGKPAKNIEGIEEKGIRAFGTEVSIINYADFAMNASGSQERSNRCVKSLCNFLLAALVLAFLLPWVFHPSKLL